MGGEAENVGAWRFRDCRSDRAMRIMSALRHRDASLVVKGSVLAVICLQDNIPRCRRLIIFVDFGREKARGRHVVHETALIITLMEVPRPRFAAVAELLMMGRQSTPNSDFSIITARSKHGRIRRIP